MRSALALVLLLLATASGAADEAVFAHPHSAEALRALLSAPARELSGAQTLRGRFTQRKFLRELPTPLPSDGDFLFARDLGIAWHTLHPLDSEFILTRSGMLQKDGGKLALQVSADRQPALQVALRLFVALFSLDLDSLHGDFELYGHKTGERWQLGLKPRQAAMRSVFDRALIEGGDRVERIELHDRNGDRTDIAIVEMRSGAAASAEDRRRFTP